MVDETGYVLRVSFLKVCTETLHADCNTELRAFLGKMQVIKLAKKRPVLYNTKVLCRSHKTHKRTNVMQLGSMFICKCNIALHVSDALCVHLQEHLETVEVASGE